MHCIGFKLHRTVLPGAWKDAPFFLSPKAVQMIDVSEGSQSSWRSSPAVTAKNVRKLHGEKKMENTQVTRTEADKHLMTSSPRSGLLSSCACKHLLRLPGKSPLTGSEFGLGNHSPPCPSSNTREWFWMCGRSDWMETTYHLPSLEQSPARDAFREEMFQKHFLSVPQESHRSCCTFLGKLGKAKWKFQSSALLTWPASVVEWFIVLHFCSKKVTGSGMIHYKRVTNTVGVWRKLKKNQ